MPQGPGSAQLYLRDEQLRLSLDLLLLSGLEMGHAVAPVLAEAGLGRAHHRVLSVVRALGTPSVGEVLSLLAITKQSLGRVLRELITRGYLARLPDPRDARVRRLSLTERGAELERLLFERQRALLATACREAGGPSVEGFRRVLSALAPRASLLAGAEPR